MELDPRQLRYALAIARAGSFIGAAKVLHVTQPALSSSIQRLEQTVGVKIFERSRRGAKLTPDGQLVLRHAHNLENVLAHAKRDFALRSRGHSAVLRVGATPVAMMTVVPRALPLMQSEIGRVNVEFMGEGEDRLAEALLSYEIDAAICTLNLGPPQPEFEDTILFRSNSVSVVVNPRHPLVGMSKIRLSDLSGQQFVLPSAGSAFRKQLEAFFFVAGVDFPSAAIEVAPFAGLREILLSTPVVGLLPWQIIKSDTDIGRLVAIPLHEASGSRTIGIRTLRGHPQSSTFQNFVKHLISVSPIFDDGASEAGTRG